MKVLGVAIPGTHLEQPGAITSGLAAQRLFYRGIDQDADNRRILRCGPEDLGIFLVPHFRIDVELISRDQIGGRAELTFLPALHVVRHRLEPDIDVEADLMAGVVGDHRSAARLRHVPDQKTVPADLFRVPGEPFDEANELRIAPIAVARRPHDLPIRSGHRQRYGAGEAAKLSELEEPDSDA